MVSILRCANVCDIVIYCPTLTENIIEKKKLLLVDAADQYGLNFS